MKDSDFPEFSAHMLAVAELYDKALTKQVLKLKFNALKDLELEDVKVGISRHVNDPASGMFMPKPANIRRHVQGKPEDRALKAWMKLEEAVCEVGAYESVAFDDPVLMAVVKGLGGWIRICGITEKQAPFLQREFEKRYLVYADTPAQHVNHTRKLPGIHEIENTRGGFRVAPPVLFGNQEKAQRQLNGDLDKSGEVLARLQAETDAQPERQHD